VGRRVDGEIDQDSVVPVNHDETTKRRAVVDHSDGSAPAAERFEERLLGRRDRHDRSRCEEVQILSGAPNQVRRD
jgi:hypothetical protein